jgi:cytochrome c-type biogenesis protein CcmF
MEYTGEQLWAGQLGHAFVIVGFATAILSMLLYFIGYSKKDESYRKLARGAYLIHALSMIGMVGTLFVMLAGNMFEYHYIFQHSSSNLPAKYIFSAFWEGQEGSTLLWLFWQAILGLILMYSSKRWEYSVMGFFTSAQVFLLTMVLGFYVGDMHIGSSPFTILLREHPNFALLPFVQSPNYLDTLDGSGLNPLLQNYWMTIHPPTLFLGFASTLVPFAYALAGLLERDYRGWFQQALPWTFFSIMILGTGILMGGAWAYESLSFGGFWAWDPVENASLVPWLTLVGGGHLLLIQKNKGTSLFSAYFLIVLTYILILYSTFLTKSGVLGDSSVHAFTDLGLSGQLVFIFGSYAILGFGMLAWRYKDLPKNKKEDGVWTREFWMFIAALVLLLSAFQITFSTSIPVWNKLFGTEMAPPADPNAHYNGYQLPFAVIIGLIVGFTQFLNYKRTDLKTFFSQTLRALIASLILTIVIGLIIQFDQPLLLLMLFSSLYAVLGNADYLLMALKRNIPIGSSIAHIGFGMVLLGSLISQGGAETISQNSSRYNLEELDDDYKNNENILLMLEDTLTMGDYRVTYKGKESEGIYVYYNVAYLDSNNQEQFTLSPFVQLNNRMGNVAEPSTKHYWNKDVFTFIKYAELEDREEDLDPFKDAVEHDIKIGDTIYASNAIIILDSIAGVMDLGKKQEFGLNPEDLLVRADIRMYDFDTQLHHVSPHFAAQGTQVKLFPVENKKVGVKLEMYKIDPTSETIGLRLYEYKYKTKEFIIMQAMVFPHINILWIGAILMIIGSVWAIYNRLRTKRKES